MQIRGGGEKSVEWLLQIVPDTKHVFIPIRYDTKAAGQGLIDFRDAASKTGVRVTVVEVASKNELRKALATLPDDVDAIFLLPSMLVSSAAAEIAQIAMKINIPVGATICKADDGALFSFSPKQERMGRQASKSPGPTGA